MKIAVTLSGVFDVMPALVDSGKTSSGMQKALHAHIIKEREKRKQEAAEAEKDFERKAKEEEEKRKKLEEEHSTLEDIKKQLAKLNEKQESLRQEKHQLFSQLKKVLHEEGKRKALLREQNEMSSTPPNQYHQHRLSMNPHHLLPPGLRYQNHHQSPYIAQGGHASPGQQQKLQQGLKRPHSPTPPTSGTVQMFQSSSIHSSPQQKYDSGYSGVPSAYQSNRGSTPDRPSNDPYSYSNPPGKPQDHPMYNMDNRSRSRITMIPPNQSSPFSAHLQMRSNSPGRYNIKSERDHNSYSPSSGNPSHHKYHSSQGSGKMYSKH